MPTARLLLEDGTLYEGESFGSAATAIGEVVFNTSLTGYQEIATDPSYRFQIVVMTYPHIGNYGVERSADQSDHPQVAGFVVRDIIAEPSNAHSEMPLTEYFEQFKISAISGIDTRALTRKIRNEGAMRGIISTDPARSIDDPSADRSTTSATSQRKASRAWVSRSTTAAPSSGDCFAYDMNPRMAAPSADAITTRARTRAHLPPLRQRAKYSSRRSPSEQPR